MRLGLVLTLSLLLYSYAEALDRIRIAVSNPNMPNLTMAVAQKKGFLKDEGIEAEVIRMNPNVSITALKQKVVDVIVTSPPADSQLEKQGFNILARAHEFFNLPYLGLGVNNRKLRERPDEVKRVIRAGIKANRYIYENREEAV